MKFALVLFAVCSHGCDISAQRPQAQTFSSFHDCFVSGFSVATREDQRSGGHWKFKCVLQQDQVRSRPTPPSAGDAIESRLIRQESGGDPTLVNRFGYAGLYQFGAPLLVDLGVYTPGFGESLNAWSKLPRATFGKWSGTFDIPGFPEVKRLTDFLGTPAAQEAVFRLHSLRMQRQISSYGFDKYLGTKLRGIPITFTGLEYMIHLGGAGGVAHVLRSSGRLNPRDANGTSLLDYARMGTSSEANSVPIVSRAEAAIAGP